jgi:hypothetical protein
MPDTFTAFLPFAVSSHADLTTPLSVVVDGHHGEIVKGRTDYELHLGGIGTEAEAVQLLRKGATALLWASIELGFAVRVDPTPNPVTLLDAPAPLHSIRPGVEGYTDYGACVFPDGLDIAKFRLYPPERLFSVPPPERVVALVAEGATFPNAEGVWNTDRVPVAMRMFAESQFQTSPYGGFLGCINVLEILKTQQPRSAGASAVVDQWIKTLCAARRAKSISPDEYQSMRSALGYQKETSIGQAIRELVSHHLGPEAAREAAALYEIRSELVHHGKGDEEGIQRAYNRAVELVRRLLRTFLERSLS